MKYIISLTILLSIIALPAHSELTPTDLDKIREIVKETEKQTKEYVNIKFDSLEKILTNDLTALINA